MIKKFIACAVVLAFVAPPHAAAQTNLTAGFFLSTCGPGPSSTLAIEVWCLSYLRGVIEGLRIASPDWDDCLGKTKPSLSQLREMMKAEIREHPKLANLTASSVAAATLTDKVPACKRLTPLLSNGITVRP
jgi:hypothetical protein